MFRVTGFQQQLVRPWLMNSRAAARTQPHVLVPVGGRHRVNVVAFVLALELLSFSGPASRCGAASSSRHRCLLLPPGHSHSLELGKLASFIMSFPGLSGLLLVVEQFWAWSIKASSLKQVFWICVVRGVWPEIRENFAVIYNGEIVVVFITDIVDIYNCRYLLWRVKWSGCLSGDRKMSCVG